MRIGYSLLLREFVEADEVEHGDCADFQIVCPSCSEAVFKVGDRDSERRYLSHYRGTKSDVAQCELRVASISRSAIDQANGESRGQLLELFQRRFLEATLEAITEADTAEDKPRSKVRSIVASATSRPTFRALLRDLRPKLARQIEIEAGMIHLLGDGDVYRTPIPGPDGVPVQPQSDFWIARQTAYARDYARHLFAPGSLRTLYDAAAIGVLKMQTVVDAVGMRGENAPFFVEAAEALLSATDSRLGSFVARCRRTTILHEGRMAPRSLMLEGVLTQCIGTALIEFPYVQAAMDPSGRKADAAAQGVLTGLGDVAA